MNTSANLKNYAASKQAAAAIWVNDTALFHAGEWKRGGLGSAAVSEVRATWPGAVLAFPWTGRP